jgi:hypothetical protein
VPTSEVIVTIVTIVNAPRSGAFEHSHLKRWPQHPVDSGDNGDNGGPQRVRKPDLPDTIAAPRPPHSDNPKAQEDHP